MLKQRVASAIVLAPIIIVPLYLGGVPFALLLALLSCLSAGEYRNLLGNAQLELHYVFIPICIMIALTGLSHESAYLFDSLLIGALLLLSLSAIQKGIAVGAFGVSGAIYIGGFWGTMGLLRTGPDGREWAFLVLFVTWAADIAAFFGGRAWGRHKLAPMISPGKTWEGTVFGIAASTLVSVLWGIHMSLAVWQCAIIGICLGIMAVTGDLVESSLKRYCNSKDSGNLIPGHGGVLDRFDSVLFTSAGGFVIRELLQVFHVI